jgi:hypothetical protein
MKKLLNIIAAVALASSGAFAEENEAAVDWADEAKAERGTPDHKHERLKYTISSTGKRHNSTCRYYGKGRPAGPNEGIPCKICGG